MRKLGLVSLFLVSTVLFQNFASVKLAKFQVNEKSRQLHAKELLGKMYKKSNAAKFDAETALNNEIFNEVDTQLPVKYQSKSEKITKTILTEANRYNIDPVFIISIIKTESDFDPLAKGTSGEIGLMQLMPSTAEYIAKKINMKYHGAKTLRDPIKNIKLGTAYFNYLREKFDNKAYRYVPAYNVGPGKITKVEHRKDIPKIYSEKVIKHYESFYKKIAQSQKDPTVASLTKPTSEARQKTEL